MTSLIFLVALTCIASVASDPSMTGCGTTKTCVTYPKNCMVPSVGCMFFSFARDEQTGMYTMELSGSSGSMRYVAVAFGLTNKMQDADLYVCTGSELRSGSIKMRFIKPSLTSSLPTGVMQLNASIVNNVAYCKFTRAQNVTKPISGNKNQVFDLLQNDYYVLMAIGDYKNGAIKYHMDKRFVTTQAIDFGNEKTNSFSNEQCGADSKICVTIKWRYVKSRGVYHMELSGPERFPGFSYVSIAFGTSPHMQTADVYFCTKDKLYSGTIGQQSQRPTIHDALPKGVKFISYKAENGNMKCVFERPASVKKDIAFTGFKRTIDFNIRKKSLYVLFCFGIFFSGQPFYHRQNRWHTPNPVKFSTAGMMSPITDGCGSEKQCYFNVDGCNPISSGCFVLTWQYNDDESKFDFEMSGSAGKGKHYSAFAFAPMPVMQNGDAYFCTGTDLLTGKLPSGIHNQPLIDENYPSAISNVEAYTQNGIARCSFTRSASNPRMFGAMINKFDISTTNYYILSAMGAFTVKPLQHSASARWFTQSVTNFTFVPPPPINAGCGVTKLCTTNKPNCNPSDAGCIFFSWAYDMESNTFDIEFSAGMLAAGQYVAVGFTRVGVMENADVYVCTGGMLKTGIIGARHSPPVLDSNLPAGVTNVASRTQNGATVCSFTRDASLTRMISGQNMEFDLSTNLFYVLFCTGGFINGVMVQHSPTSRWVTPGPVEFVPPPPINDGCGDTKQCVTNVNQCNPEDSGCVFLSWVYNGDSNTFDIEFSGGQISTGLYVSFGFASKAAMENADIYVCTGGMLKTGTIGARHSPPVLDSNLPAGITNPSARVQDGATICSFTRNANMIRNISGQNMKFDISANPFHILFCFGKFVNGMLVQHSATDRWVTPSPVTFFPPINFGCGNDKNCLSNIPNCQPSDKDCVFFTYNYNADSNTFDIEFSGGKISTGLYVSIGFAPKAAMENADIYVCTGGMLKTGIIGARQSPPVLDSNLPTGVTNPTSRTQDGATVCSFTRASNITRTIGSNNLSFDLSSNPFYILFCTGVYAGGVLLPHTVSTRWLSSSAVNFAPQPQPESTQSPPVPQPESTQSPPVPQPESTQSAPLPPTTPPKVGCGFTQFCISSHSPCVASSCVTLKITYNKSSNNFDITFTGPKSMVANYAAIAFAPTRKMADADLYVCSDKALRTGAILGKIRPTVEGLPQTGISNSVATSSGGTQTCSFTRSASVTRKLNSGNVDFDFTKTKYHVLFCFGRAAGKLIFYHGSNKWSSSKSFDFRKPR